MRKRHASQYANFGSLQTLFDIMSTDYTIQIYYVLLDSTNIQILFRMS